MMKKVYFDYGAATPTHPQVMEAMIPYLGEFFGNPQSLHDWGQEARELPPRGLPTDSEKAEGDLAPL